MSLPGWRLVTPEPREVVDHLVLAELHVLVPVDAPAGGLARVREIRDGVVVGERAMALDPGTVIPAEVLTWIQGLLVSKGLVPNNASPVSISVTRPEPPPTPPGQGLGTLR